MIKGAEKLPFYFYSLNGKGIHPFCALKGGLSGGAFENCLLFGLKSEMG